MRNRLAVRFGAMAIALIAVAAALPATTADAVPSGPASNACGPVTEVLHMLQDKGLDTTHIYNVVSRVCPL